MISHSDGTRNCCGRNARARGLHSSGSTCRGFSLPELLVSMAVLLVVAGAGRRGIDGARNRAGRIGGLAHKRDADAQHCGYQKRHSSDRRGFFDHFDVCRGSSAGGHGNQRRAGNYHKSHFDLDHRHLCKQSSHGGRRHPCDRCCSQRNRSPFFQRHNSRRCFMRDESERCNLYGYRRFDLQCPEHLGRP